MVDALSIVTVKVPKFNMNFDYPKSVSPESCLNAVWHIKNILVIFLLETPKNNLKSFIQTWGYSINLCFHSHFEKYWMDFDEICNIVLMPNNYSFIIYVSSSYRLFQNTKNDHQIGRAIYRRIYWMEFNGSDTIAQE